jgi:hypothetical protein
MGKGKMKTPLPRGWNAKRLRATLAYYENQSDDEAAAEIEEGFDAETETAVIVPKKLVPVIKALLAGRKARAG